MVDSANSYVQIWVILFLGKIAHQSSGGGVFIMVRLHLSINSIKQGVKIELVGIKPLYIAAYYRPKEDDDDNAEELKKILSLG